MVNSELLEKAPILSDQQLQCSHVQHKYTVQNKIKGTEGLI